MSIAVFVTKARNIQNQLSLPEFSSISPTPAEVLPKLAEIDIYIREAEVRNFQHTPKRNMLRAEVELMLKKQCMAVNGLALGDEPTLSKSGFALNKVPQSRPVPSDGRLVMMKEGQKYGQLIVKTEKMKDCLYYLAEARDTKGNTYSGHSTRNEITVEGVPVDELVQVRFTGVNAKGTGDWSPYYEYKLSSLRMDRPMTNYKPSSL